MVQLDEDHHYEIEVAASAVGVAAAAELGADPQRLNPRGGAIALGHPLGGSGVRLMATLVNHLEQTGGRYGLQTMCEAGGQANATIVERTSPRFCRLFCTQPNRRSAPRACPPLTTGLNLGRCRQRPAGTGPVSC